MSYPHSPIQCKYCKHLEKKIGINKDKEPVGKCRAINRTVHLDKIRECAEFKFFLETQNKHIV